MILPDATYGILEYEGVSHSLQHKVWYKSKSGRHLPKCAVARIHLLNIITLELSAIHMLLSRQPLLYPHGRKFHHTRYRKPDADRRSVGSVGPFLRWELRAQACVQFVPKNGLLGTHSW